MAKSSAKLNIGYMDVPRAFFGKIEKHAKYGAANFVVNNKRFTGSKILTLSLINTEYSMNGYTTTMPYSDFKSSLALSNATVWRNLKELSADKIIENVSRSKYEIRSAFSGEQNVRVYEFLLTDEINLGGTVKRLSKNAVLYLSEIIASTLLCGNNPKPFVGGYRRAAKTINMPKSTTRDVVNELIATKCIYSKQLKQNGNNDYIINNGKGESKKILTGYVVNSALMSIVRKIEKIISENAEIQSAKKLIAQPHHKPKPDYSVSRRSDGTGKYDKYLPAPSSKENVTEFEKLETLLNSDTTYQALKRAYCDSKNRWSSAILKNDPASDELEDKMTSAKNDLLTYLYRLSPDKLPPNLENCIDKLSH